MKDKHIGKIKQIFGVGWEAYCKNNPVRPAITMNVHKMMACRTELMGFRQWVCPSCGVSRKVPHTCKSRFCSICGMVATENWIRRQFGFLLNCSYQHVVVTIPFEVRWIAKRCRKEVLCAMSRIAAVVMMEWAQERGFQIGIVSFFHSFGETLQSHPHFHMIVTSGGLTEKGTWHVERSAFPAHILMPRYRARMLSFLKELLLSGKVKTKASKWFHIKELAKTTTHWQFYVEKITHNQRSMILYITRYVKRMIMSEKRIVDWDNKVVSFMTHKGRLLVYKLDQFIACLVQHIPDRYFHLVRYYGIYAPASRKRYAKALPFWGTLQKRFPPSTWRDRQAQRLGYDPLHCQTCRTDLLPLVVSYPRKWAELTWQQLLDANGIAYQLKLEGDNTS